MDDNRNEHGQLQVIDTKTDEVKWVWPVDARDMIEQEDGRYELVADILLPRPERHVIKEAKKQEQKRFVASIVEKAKKRRASKTRKKVEPKT